MLYYVHPNTGLASYIVFIDNRLYGVLNKLMPFKDIWIIRIVPNTMHCFSSFYWVITPIHVSGISAWPGPLTAWKYYKYHLPHIHILPPDDGLLIPRNV
jgi:hypothetical protein